jgi:hypothetical protein
MRPYDRLIIGSDKSLWIHHKRAHPITNTRFMRLFIHPLKQRIEVEEFLNALKAAVQ